MRINEDYINVPADFSEEREAQIHSEKFKSVFGDWENDPEHSSKCVDAAGRPMLLYHSYDNENYDSGLIYLSTSEDFSSEFGDTTEEFFVNLRNPYITEDDEILRDADGNEIYFDGEPASIGYLDSVPEEYLIWLQDNFDGVMDPTRYFVVAFDKDSLIKAE